MLTFLSLLLWPGSDNPVTPSAPTALILEGHFQQLDLTTHMASVIPTTQFQVLR